MSRVLVVAALAAAAWLLVAAAIIAPFSLLWVPGVLVGAGCAWLYRTSPQRAAERRARRRKGYLHAR